MRIAAKYSHMNGEEFLLVHKPDLWDEVCDAIQAVDAESCRTKKSEEKRKQGKMLYSPTDMNFAFQREFYSRDWSERYNKFWTTHDESVLRQSYKESEEKQKSLIQRAGYDPIMSYNQTDFVKNKVAVEVQFGKYAFVAHDLFVKHLSFFLSGVIDIGIEILPMKSLEAEMSSGVPYYERDLINVIRQERGVPAVPLVLIGITP